MQFKANTVLLASALLFAATASAQEVVRIAHVGDITGSLFHLGKDNENGARMAIDELNARGISIGGKKVKFVLVAEDDAADPKKATGIAQKLVDAKVHAVVGHMNSGATISAAKIYSEAGIPQISPSATSPKYTQIGFKTAFRMVATDAQLGAILGRYAVQVAKAKKIAVIDDRTAYGVGLAQEFVNGVNSKRGSVTEIVATAFTSDTARDFSDILTKIKAKNPDLIFFGGMDATAGPLLAQIRGMGINAKFMGGDGICTSMLGTQFSNYLGNDSVLCAQAGDVEDSGRKAMDDFKAAYRKKFSLNIEIYAPYAYDAVMVLADAMAKANSYEPAKYLPVLARTSYKGVTGSITFDNKGDRKDTLLGIYTFKGGNRQLLTVTK